MLFILTSKIFCALKNHYDEQSFLHYEDVPRQHITEIENVFNKICNPCCTMDYIRQVELVDEYNEKRIKVIEKYDLWNVNTFEMLLDNGAQIVFPNNDILIKAIERKNIELVKLLINRGFDINYFSCIPLQTAIKCSFDIVKLLVESGVSLKYAISHAFESGDIKTIKYLVDHVTNPDYNQGLASACINGNFDAVKYAIGCGADVCYNDNFPFEVSTIYYYMDIIKYLIDSGVNIHCKDDMIFNSLTRRENVDINDIEYLLHLGIDVNARSGLGLKNAAMTGRNDIIELLVNNGANIHIGNNAPMFHAVMNGNFETAQYLIKLGSDVSINDNELLMILCSKRTYFSEVCEMIKFVLDYGADINARNNLCLIKAIDDPPLFLSNYPYYIDLIKFLVDTGADIYSRLDEMIEIATKKLNPKVGEYLESFRL